ncbi:LptE family protein [Porphyromonas sp.]
MVWNSLISRHTRKLLGLLSLLLILSSCKISYKFTGTSIDYEQTKTVSITEFINQAPLVYPPLSQSFTEALRELFRRQTRLEEVAQAGDFSIEGSIIGYDLTPVAVQEDAFASMTRFTMTVSVHFENNANPKKNFDRTFSAYTEFDSSSLFSQVQDDLVRQLTEDITKQIFNATAEDW